MRNTTWVKAGKHGWVKVSDVKVLDCSSDFQGRDELTFSYGGEEQFKSIVVSGSQPG
jgi:hypothetical protein